MKQKGSVKDKLKSWWFVLQYKRKKEKEEKEKEIERIRLWKEKNKGKYYSKSKIILLTIAGLFLGLFEPTLSKKQKKENINIEIEKSQVPLLQEQIKTIKEEISILKKELEQEKDISTIVSKEEKLIEKKEQLNILEEKQIPALSKEKINSSEITTHKELLKDHKIIKEIIQETKNIQKEIDNNKETAYFLVQKEKLKENNKKMVIYKKKYEESNIITTSKSIPKNMICIEEINEDIKLFIDISVKCLEGIDEILKQRKEALQDIILVKQDNEKQSDLPKDFYQEQEKIVEKAAVMDLEQIEEEIEKSVVAETLAVCVLKIENIEEKTHNKKTQERCVNQKEKAIDKIEKNMKKAQTHQRTEDELSEILYMEALVYNNLLKQKKEIKQLSRRMAIASPYEKKKTFLGTIRGIANHAIRLTFAVFPLVMFRNKGLGKLASTLLVNNSIRTMRRIVGNKEVSYLEHQNIINEIKKNSEELAYSKDVCYDSLQQIVALKTEFSELFNYQMDEDSLIVFRQIGQLEDMLLAQQIELERSAGALGKIKDKGKIKVKKLHGYNGKY